MRACVLTCRPYVCSAKNAAAVRTMKHVSSNSSLSVRSLSTHTHRANSPFGNHGRCRVRRGVHHARHSREALRAAMLTAISAVLVAYGPGYLRGLPASSLSTADPQYAASAYGRSLPKSRGTGIAT